ncbi:hypothetical protein [Jeotgalicoccus sp. ATCC 8456]|uniref:hypothetical protein n=1 Tax=Jeotgalicoccus sp. ATCC 8456 TaxID=946435 RepID=UPI0018E613CF|nr:hypothetical protein [Jeotgalicoccus sp. ATCC 8456]QQD85470.1 hypothetical protein JEM45_02255 [Jeotgalicoccus sp. ATCC 8456]
MKNLNLNAKGFFSLSVYFVLIYLIGVYYYYYYERFQLILDIRMNLIEIYVNQISKLIY